MKTVQEAVRAYLQEQTGIKTVADRTRVRGEYPLLAVSVQEDGTVLVGGGKLAEHTYRVTVTAIGDRERDSETALLTALIPPLLRGIPLKLDGALRHLHPLHIRTEEEQVSFSLEVCMPVPPADGSSPDAEAHMDTLHFEI